VEIAKLRNLGPRTAQWLAAIGIHSEADLRRIGSVEAWARLRCEGFPVSLNFVWAVEGALAGVHWTEIPPELKSAIRNQIEERRAREPNGSARRSSSRRRPG
jgi:DNA transformation protein